MIPRKEPLVSDCHVTRPFLFCLNRLEGILSFYLSVPYYNSMLFYNFYTEEYV